MDEFWKSSKGPLTVLTLESRLLSLDPTSEGFPFILIGKFDCKQHTILLKGTQVEFKDPNECHTFLKSS